MANDQVDEDAAERGRPQHDLLIDKGPQELDLRTAEQDRYGKQHRQIRPVGPACRAPHGQHRGEVETRHEGDRDCATEAGVVRAREIGGEQKGQTQERWRDPEIGIGQTVADDALGADYSWVDVERTVQQVQQHAVERQPAQRRREKARDADRNQKRVIATGRDEAQQHDAPVYPPGAGPGAGHRIPLSHDAAQRLRPHAEIPLYARCAPLQAYLGAA